MLLKQRRQCATDNNTTLIDTISSSPIGAGRTGYEVLLHDPHQVMLQEHEAGVSGITRTAQVKQGELYGLRQEPAGARGWRGRAGGGSGSHFLIEVKSDVAELLLKEMGSQNSESEEPLLKTQNVI